MLYLHDAEYMRDCKMRRIAPTQFDYEDFLAETAQDDDDYDDGMDDPNFSDY